MRRVRSRMYRPHGRGLAPRDPLPRTSRAASVASHRQQAARAYSLTRARATLRPIALTVPQIGRIRRLRRNSSSNSVAAVFSSSVKSPPKTCARKMQPTKRLSYPFFPAGSAETASTHPRTNASSTCRQQTLTRTTALLSCCPSRSGSPYERAALGATAPSAF